MAINIIIPQAEGSANVKDAVINILAADWPLTAKSIYHKVRQKGLEVSYQAVHKVLKELMEEQVLEKENHEYKLDLGWIREVKEFGSRLENCYTDKSKPPVEKLFTGEITSVTFENLFEFFDFMIEFFTRFAGSNTLYSQWRHFWWPFAFSGERYKAFVRMVKAFKDGYLVCRGDTTADRMIFDFYTSHNRKGYGKFGVDCASECDSFVCADYVAQVFFDKDLQKKIDILYQKIEKIEPKAIKHFSEALFFEKTKIILLLNKSPELAEKIKIDTLKHFGQADKKDKNSHTGNQKQKQKVGSTPQTGSGKLR
ncbi:MAG: hypothetical protein HYX24_03165 [Candidatus Aenigmarchaeota archaeon]|nr:hypothetical protein [Candidatus Aenigmarchaeota archaeon]